MKNRNLLFVMLLLFLSIFTFQSCTDKEPVPTDKWEAALPVNPTPADEVILPYTGAQDILLKWEGTSTNPAKWDVYFGKAGEMELVATNVSTKSYTIHVTEGGLYEWQVATIDAFDVPTESDVWQFDLNTDPAAPVLATPAHNATGVDFQGPLTWSCSDPQGDELTYDVYLGKTSTPGVAAGAVADTFYVPTMEYSTKYFWKIISHDPYGGSNTSPVDSFTTAAFVPDFSVYHGIFSEVNSTFGTHDVFFSVNTTANTITMYLPVADGMVSAGWGTEYFGAHPITVTYDPVTKAVTSTTQAWTDSFIDPTEMGPMTLRVTSGTIDPVNKKLTIKWTIGGNGYWGGDYPMSSNFVYTLRVQK